MANFLSKFLARTFLFKKDLVLDYPGTAIPVIMAEPGGSNIVPNDMMLQTLDTVFACARLISEQISTIPIKVARINAQGIKTYQPEHPLQSIINNPVEYTNRNAYMQKAVYHLLLWGNHFAEINRNGLGDPIGYNLLHPKYVSINAQGIYTYDDGENKRAIQPFNVVHVTVSGEDTIMGTSIIGKAAKNDLTYALYVRRYGNGFFKNGGKPNNVILTKDNITQDQAKEWKKAFETQYSEGGTAVMGGMEKIENLTFPPDDSQFLETRMFSVETICRWFNVDPPLVGHLKDGTLSNFETIWRNFARKTLLPITEQFESEYTRKSFRDSQYKKGFRYEFDYTQLTKGSPNEEAELLRTYIQNGILTPNEARTRIGMNPEEGGDELFMQSATIPIRIINEQNEQSQQEFPDSGGDE